LKKKKTKFGVADLVVSLILAALVAFALYRIKVGLHYKWEWKAVPQFLLRYDEQKKHGCPTFSSRAFTIQ